MGGKISQKTKRHHCIATGCPYIEKNIVPSLNHYFILIWTLTHCHSLAPWDLKPTEINTWFTKSCLGLLCSTLWHTGKVRVFMSCMSMSSSVGSRRSSETMVFTFFISFFFIPRSSLFPSQYLYTFTFVIYRQMAHKLFYVCVHVFPQLTPGLEPLNYSIKNNLFFLESRMSHNNLVVCVWNTFLPPAAQLTLSSFSTFV